MAARAARHPRVQCRLPGTAGDRGEAVADRGAVEGGALCAAGPAADRRQDRPARARLCCRNGANCRRHPAPASSRRGSWLHAARAADAQGSLPDEVVRRIEAAAVAARRQGGCFARQGDDARPDTLLLFRLSPQYLDAGAGRVARTRRHRLPLHGPVDGPLDRDLHADGRRRHDLGRAGAVLGNRRTSSRTSATAPGSTPVRWPSGMRSPPGPRSPTRSSSTMRWR